VVHDIYLGEDKLESLGWEFHGAKDFILPVSRGRWRLWFSLEHALKVGKVTGRQLHRLVGHYVSCGLIRRETLCVLCLFINTTWNHTSSGLQFCVSCGGCGVHSFFSVIGSGGRFPGVFCVLMLRSGGRDLCVQLLVKTPCASIVGLMSVGDLVHREAISEDIIIELWRLPF